MRRFSKELTYVFDLDNTLVATDLANSLSYIEAIYTVTGFKCDWNFNRRFTRKNLYSICSNLSQEQYDNIVKTKKERFNDHMSETTLNTNLVKILEDLHNNSCKTILLTNCHKERAQSVCNHYGLSQFFTEAYYAEDKVGSKYDVLVRNGYKMNTIILFENEAEGAQEAMENGIDKNNIIGVNF